MNYTLKKQKTPHKGEFRLVAGPGVEPGLRDYEPHVQPYTTPHDQPILYSRRSQNTTRNTLNGQKT